MQTLLEQASEALETYTPEEQLWVRVVTGMFIAERLDASHKVVEEEGEAMRINPIYCLS